MTGTIEKIKLYPAKGQAGRELSEGRLVKDFGLEGDYHATGGERQLSLLFVDSLPPSTSSEKAEAVREKGMCLSRFKENIAIRGLERAVAGTQLASGEAVLEITGEIKHCHEGCVLHEEGKTCSLAALNLFAKVLKSGLIRTGDRITDIGAGLIN